MENLFKKFIYTGVGFVSLTTERMRDTIKGLIEDGKISKEEGKKIVDDFSKNTETKKDEIESQFKSIIEKILKSFNFATVSDLEKVENRIAVLEALLAKVEEEKIKEEEVEVVVEEIKKELDEEIIEEPKKESNDETGEKPNDDINEEKK